MDGGLLLQEQPTRLEIADFGEHAALHDCSSLVIFDVTHPARPLQCDLLGEALLLEVADSIVVGVGQEVHDVRGSLDVIFQVRHEVCAVTFDLLIAAYSAEDDFGELATLEGPVGDATYHFQRLLDDGHGQMGAVVDETGDVVLGHLRQLFLKDTLEASQDDVALAIAIVVDSSELDLAIALLDDGWFLRKWNNAWCCRLDGVSGVVFERGRGRRRRLEALAVCHGLVGRLGFALCCGRDLVLYGCWRHDALVFVLAVARRRSSSVTRM